MRAFCRLFGELDRGEGNLARIQALASHLQRVDPADAAWTLHLLLGKQRRRLITARRLRLHALRITGLPEWLLEACHAQVGDTAETIALLLEGQRQQQGDGPNGSGPAAGPAAEPPGVAANAPAPRPPAPVPIAPDSADWPLWRWMEEELPRLAVLEEADQAAALAAHWSQLQENEILVLNKVLTGAFRVGVGPGLVVKALALASGLEESLLQHRLMGDFTPSAAAWQTLLAAPAAGDMPASRPYPFLLACPLDVDRLAEMEPADWLAEWKWDGIRAQLIRRGGETFLWSRGEELINASFPDLLAPASALAEGTVLDGEVLVWPPSQPHPCSFAELQRRLGQRRPSARLLAEAPASYVVYDLLELEGVDLRPLPLGERRRRLAALLEAQCHPLLRCSTPLPLARWDDLERWRERARAGGAEGVMLKDLAAPYGSGRRRGPWWKHKLDPLRLDAVLLYARNGRGRRANLYTDYTFGLWSQEDHDTAPAAAPVDAASAGDTAATGSSTPGSSAAGSSAAGSSAGPAAGPSPEPSAPGDPGLDGSGRRLVSFASAYSGLSDAELVEIDRWIRRHTTERFGPVRAVRPELVFELAFEGVQRSSRHRSGIAVRFPRISRWRRDKLAAEADTLASALALIPP
jgi:DNA ligase-1